MGTTLFTPEYQGVLIAMHDSVPWGNKGHRQIPKFLKHFSNLRCRTLLDYGSGRERLSQELGLTHPDIKVTCYDPGIPGRDTLPEPHDYVTCTDVLEHIEPDLIENVLVHIYHLATNGAYLSIGLGHAKKILPDGRNAHLIVERFPWWVERITRFDWHIDKYQPGRKSLKLWLRKPSCRLSGRAPVA